KEHFESLVNGIELENQTFHVTDDEGRNVFSTRDVEIESDLLIRKIKEDMPAAEDHFKFTMNNKETFVSYSHDKELGYYYVLLTPSSDLQENMFLISELIMILLIVILISVFSIVLISYYLTRPIRKLAKDMKQKKISLPNEFIVKDEMWEISIQLNKVFQELKKQVDRAYQLEMKTNKAQL